MALIATGSLILTLRFGGAAKPGEAVSVARDQTSYGPKAAASPTAVALGRARSFARGRRGLVSFAVVDTSGTLACFRCRASYHSASVVKAMLLVSYLNQLSAGGEPLPADHKAYLDSMIRVSDNDAATAIYAHVGEEGLNELAWQAHMADFRISGSWGSASITAADQARFFAALNELIAPEYRMYVRERALLDRAKAVVGNPRGVSAGMGHLLQRRLADDRGAEASYTRSRASRATGSSMAIAVLTDGAPSDAYGRETIRGIASRLLGR